MSKYVKTREDRVSKGTHCGIIATYTMLMDICIYFKAKLTWKR